MHYYVSCVVIYMNFFLVIVSSSYYRDNNGFIYKKSTSNDTMIYLNCLRQPDCLVEMRFKKQNSETKLLGNHTDPPPDEHIFYKIAFEAHIKKQVKEPKNAHVTPLNLYKQALQHEFKGIWLPDGHKTKFLEKMRRIRKYNKAKPPRMRVNATDASTSPIEFDSEATPKNEQTAGKAAQYADALTGQNRQQISANQPSKPQKTGATKKNIPEATIVSSKQSVSTSPLGSCPNFASDNCNLFEMVKFASSLNVNKPESSVPEKEQPKEIDELNLIDLSTPPNTPSSSNETNKSVSVKSLIIDLMDLYLGQRKSPISPRQVRGCIIVVIKFNYIKIE